MKPVRSVAVTYEIDEGRTRAGWSVTGSIVIHSDAAYVDVLQLRDGNLLIEQPRIDWKRLTGLEEYKNRIVVDLSIHHVSGLEVTPPFGHNRVFSPDRKFRRTADFRSYLVNIYQIIRETLEEELSEF